MSFESDLKRLEDISEKLKDDSTGLEESLKLYEEASALNKKLTKMLEDVKRRRLSERSEGRRMTL